MSIFDISRAGLAVQAEAIQVTSNNVSNASTVGYKARESLFVDQYFKAVQSAGTSGTSEFGTKRTDQQGSLQASSSTLDLAIQGQGMFRMVGESTAGDDASYYYSRNGLFSADKNGYIVNANGLFLTGYQPSADLTGVTTTLSALKLPPSEVAPVASTVGVVDANLDVRQAVPLRVVAGVITDVPKTFSASDASTFNASTTVTAYDTKGLTHQVTIYFKKVDATVVNDPRSLSVPAAQATASQYEVYMVADGVLLTRAAAGTVGTGMLGSASETAAAQALVLENASIAATATAEAKANYYRSAVADEAAADVALNAALTDLAAVLPSAALSATWPEASALVTASSTLVTANSDVTASKVVKGQYETTLAAATAALAATSTTDANYATLTAAVTAAQTALDTYSTGTYAAFLATQTTAETAFDTALTTAQGTSTIAFASNADTLAAYDAIAAYDTADTASTAAATATVAALAAQVTAVAAATVADDAHKASVAANRIGTLQFVDGQLVGSLTRNSVTGDPSLPAVFNAEMSDSSGNPLFDLNLDFSDITAYATAFQVREASADGYAPGDLSGVSVDEMGFITGQYTNGKSLVAGQLILATFNSEANLEAVSQSVFAETFASGEPVLGTGTSGSYGAIRSAMLEQSNIDMAGELVNLMIQQRNYQANSQGIKAADTVLTTAINLSR